MSKRKLAGWPGFVANLEKFAGLPADSRVSPEVRAKRAATTLRNSLTAVEYWEIVGRALMGEETRRMGIPEQTRALASIYWPLTVSTNV